MRYSLIYNYSKLPLLVYDGGEPKKISYKVYDTNKKLLCKVDLWQGTDDKLNNDKKEIDAINVVLGLTKKISLGMETIVVPINGNDTLVYLASCSNLTLPQEQIIVFFSLFEKQPGRYQCYVIGVVKGVID